MTRLNVLLLLATIFSALYLVHSQYDARRLYAQLYRERSDARELASEYDRLQVERQAQATPLRVEKIARDQLKMRPTSPAITTYVSRDGSIPASIPGDGAPAVVAPQRTPVKGTP